VGALLTSSTYAATMDGPSSIVIPATVVPGEVMVLYVSRGPQLVVNASATTKVLSMSGWSALHDASTGSAAGLLCSMAFYRIASVSDPGSTLVIANSAATGVMQLAHLTTWDSSGVYAYSTSIATGSGTTVTWVNPGSTATQRVGDTLLALGTLRSNYASGYNSVTYPAAIRLSGTVFYDTPFLSGVPTGQTLQGMAGMLTIPTAKAGSTMSGTTALHQTSRTTYVIELGPTVNKGALRIQARMGASAGQPENFGVGPMRARAAIRALAQPKPPRQGILDAYAAITGSGQPTETSSGQGVLDAQVAMAASGFSIIDIHATLDGTATMAGSGYSTRTGTGTLRAASAVTARGISGDDVQLAYGSGMLATSVAVEAEGMHIGEHYDLEIVYSTQGLAQKGVTLAPSLTLVLAGTPIAVDRVDGYGYPYEVDGPDGRDRPIGVLRRTVVAKDLEEPANVVVAGLLRRDSLTGHAIRTLVDKRNAAVSLGRGVVRF
jgi:hypothetical protein